MTEAEYNALAAARKYVWYARRDGAKALAEISAGIHRRRAEAKLTEIEADLAKIDAALDAEDSR